MEKKPDVFMIGGANGAGKTTAALLLLPRYLETFEFVNADEIARGLNPVKPETADVEPKSDKMIFSTAEIFGCGKEKAAGRGRPHAQGL